MRKLLIVCLLFNFVLAFSGQPELLEKPSIVFTENKGQVHDQNYNFRSDVLFSGNINGMAFHLRVDGVSYQFSKIDSWKEVEDNRYLGKEKERKTTLKPDRISIDRVDINWLNSNRNPQVETGDIAAGFDNYYSESCPGGALNVRSFKSVRYKNIYRNVDLIYYEKDGHIKYDYVVQPNADYKQIKFQISGAENIQIQKDGSLKIETASGVLSEEAPVVYQEGERLKAKWVLTENVLAFEIEGYRQDMVLIIDPVIRSWGTYYGGYFEDLGGVSSKDLSGNIYLTGSTNSLNNIATTGSHQNNLIAYSGNAFLVKFNNDGVRQWSTYYGGRNESGASCSADSFGNVYLLGNESDIYTTSINSVIATPGSYQTAYHGGQSDCFIVKFNGNGVRQWGTFFGGEDFDVGTSCATDIHGNIYFAGYTHSTTDIASIGSQQASPGGGPDCFLAKFDPSGNRLWATYCGGSAWDTGRSCSTDSFGNVLLAGQTSSTNNISTTNGFHSTYAGGFDGFLAKYDSAGVKLWATYYGGDKEDWAHSCCTDGSGTIYLCGTAGSDSSISTSGSHQPLIGGGPHGDAFIAQFKSSGHLIWCTYYGGAADDFGTSCAADEAGNVYLAGQTSSTSGTVISTPGSPQSNYGGGFTDAFLVKFDNSGTRLWATYYGGSGGNQSNHGDGALSCVVNSSVSVFLSGATASSDSNMIASSLSFQSLFGGYRDVFLAKFSECEQFPTASIINNSNSNVLCKGETITLTANGAASYVWSNGLPGISTHVSPSITTTYKVIGFDGAGCSAESAITIYVDLCTGLTEGKMDRNEIIVYPNPTAGKIIITSKSAALNTIEIYDSFGRLINTFSLSQNQSEIDISHYANGIYFIKGSGNNSYLNKKIIKE